MQIDFIRKWLLNFKERFKLRFYSGQNVPEYPLLTNLFSIEQLENYGKALACMVKLDLQPGKDKLLARLADNEKVLTETYDLLTAGEEAKLSLTPAGVWFLDNFYLIKEQIQIARKHLPKSYSQELPRIHSGPFAGLPRVYHIVKELISHVDGLVDEGNLSSIVRSYQTVAPLKLGELWAIPIMLRLAMIDNIRHIALRINASRRDRNLANFWADRMLETAQKDPKNIILDMADMSRSKLSMTSSFVAEIVRRLQHQNPALILPLTWIEQRLTEQGQTIEHQVQLDNQHQAVNQVSISNSITSLRFLTMVNWKNFVENMSLVEQVLRKDPAGIYHKMNFTTRDNYRHVIEKLARQSRVSEENVALQAIKLAVETATRVNKTVHVGSYLIGKDCVLLERAVRMRLKLKDRINRIGKKAPLFFYLGSIFSITAGLSALVLFVIQPAGDLNRLLLGFLLLLSFSQLSIALVNWASTILVPPKLLPRMDFSGGVPREYCTLITVPTMLSSLHSIGDLLNKMEVCYLSNKADNVYFSLLTDFKDSVHENMPEDEELLETARKGIQELNGKYSHHGFQPFLFFHRPRQWNPEEKLWMGYERKRGKLDALNKALRTGTVPELLVEGDPLVLPQIKYVLTLDTDTQLPHDAARQLIETMAHPLNIPVYDVKKQRVVAGYTILQPRVVSSLSTAKTSWYSRLFGSDSGIDPYTRAVSDVYQDLFQEGSFIGKGIYDVDMITQVLSDRLPENRILSHDLLEGTYCRSGLVSDVQLIDEFPEHYSEDISRRHRWVRGDWQILSWLLPIVPGFKKKSIRNPISPLSWWKIFDNLRRSIFPVGLLALIVLSWLFLQPYWLGLALAAMIIFVPALPGIIQQSFSIPSGYPFFLHVQSTLLAIGRQFIQALFMLMTLPYEAFTYLDAIFRTCWRVLFTRQKLLEWVTSGEAKQSSEANCWTYIGLMMSVPLFTIVLGFLYLTFEMKGMWSIGVLLGIWFISPVLTWLVSRPLVQHKSALTSKQIGFLRKISRKTWRFFETFAGPEDNWLPVDNYQEEPKEALAHRTSPTNIGLMLLSNLGAFDLGYISAGQMIDRTKKTLKTMREMTRYRGHFLNWYDTKTLAPLNPHYISTVDSGNLAGNLLTLRSGLLEIKDRKIFQQKIYRGLTDILFVLEDLLTVSVDYKVMVLKKKPPFADRLNKLRVNLLELELHPQGLSKTFKNLSRILSEMEALKLLLEGKSNPEADWWFKAFEDQCTGQQADLLFLAPWLATDDQENKISEAVFHVLDNNHTLCELARLNEFIPSHEDIINNLDPSYMGRKVHQTQDFYSELEHQVRQGSNRAQGRMDQLEQMAGLCQSMANFDYDFLYDTSRNLLSIGYNVSMHKRDESFYDLLASEARLCSFVGIAQGKLPLEHWFALGRLVTISKGKVMLLSWGGSMFEYLMPQLIMPDYENTLLSQTFQGIVESQISYGHKRGVPWGISESAENMTDASLNYQYRSFGVPDLGFKRGLANHLVISPYASVLALMIKPDKACVNMQKLSERGFEGRFGFYEAIDYTPNRLSHEETEALIRSFMAHHQGMSFISLVNYFTGDRMKKRFESDPLFQTAVLLLQERIPKVTPFHIQPSELYRIRAVPDGQEDQLRVYNTPHTPFPEVHLLSNGHYHVMVTNTGGGYSRWRELSVTRWSEDQTRDNCGSFFYIKDLTSESLWSSGFQPTLVKPRIYEAIFLQSRAEFRRRDQGLDTYTEIAVSPEDDIEHRRISLSNFTIKTRTIELTSYAEVVLITPAAEAVHPAFSNLFMQTHIEKGYQAILSTRRPRSPGENPPWMFHLLVVNETEQFEVSYETDRLKFIGRGRTVNNPLALEEDGPLSGTEGPVLDPVVSIRCRLTLRPGETVTIRYITGVAETRPAAMALIEKYQDRRLADRVFDIAPIHGKVVLQQLNATDADAQLYGRLASSVLYASQYRRANPAILIKNKRGQSGLWAYSISGDLPIVLLRISDQMKITLAAQLIQAHAYWRLKGLQVDLVILNEDRSGYRQILNDMIVGLIAERNETATFDRKGGIFLRYSEQIPEDDRVLIQTAARVIITDNSGTLTEQIARFIRTETAIPKLIAIRDEHSINETDNFKQENLLYYNGWGGFTEDGREYVIHMRPGEPTPMPWVNVIANRQFGTVVTQSGGYTWFENAHEFRLTPWYNDPICDNSGEALYLRDETTGLFWSPLPLPAPSSSDYLNRQGFGYSVFEHITNEIQSELWIFVDVEAPVKFWLLKVRNDSNSVRRMSATSFLEPVLGDLKTNTQMYVKTEIDAVTGAFFVTNPYNTEFSGRTMFLEANESRRSMTGDRTEFLGRNGTLGNPAAMHNLRLSGTVGAGYDPAAAIQVYFDLEPGQEKEVVFILGVGRDVADARNLLLKHRSTLSAYKARDRVWEYWKHTLGTINVETPDPAINMMANGWLVYQTMASRLWARSGFYQSGGAFGFRDQLQDVSALVHAKPEFIREHLLLCASRQFREGDVQHWWHPPQGRGVRTQISDDYLWLPLITSDYVMRTGDTGVLDEAVSFLESRLLNPGEESCYDLPVISEVKASLYDHCKAAVLHGLKTGQHGLPLMGSGDWNDGMNLVGAEGKGESVWLAFFLYYVLQQFAPLAKSHGDQTFAQLCEESAEKLKVSIDTQAWDGEWYRRAYFDNGTPLGSVQNQDCQIDAIAQSWSVLSGAGSPDKTMQAMDSLMRRLISTETGLIRLLDPPFDKADMEPGYIKGYVPGVRENGGQYTHAAVWSVMAFAKMGDREKVKELLALINPVNHGSSREKIKVYKVEPYVMAGDIYGAEPHVGRGGWSWYTGSASWMYRLIVESVLGLDLKGGSKLYFKPCMPADWEKYTVHYRFRETVYHLEFNQTASIEGITVTVDGVMQTDHAVSLLDDRKEHKVQVEVGIKA